jgi:hypothetical protein
MNFWSRSTSEEGGKEMKYTKPELIVLGQVTNLVFGLKILYLLVDGIYATGIPAYELDEE